MIYICQYWFCYIFFTVKLACNKTGATNNNFADRHLSSIDLKCDSVGRYAYLNAYKSQRVYFNQFQLK